MEDATQYSFRYREPGKFELVNDTNPTGPVCGTIRTTTSGGMSVAEIRNPATVVGRYRWSTVTAPGHDRPNIEYTYTTNGGLVYVADVNILKIHNPLPLQPGQQIQDWTYDFQLPKALDDTGTVSLGCSLRFVPSGNPRPHMYRLMTKSNTNLPAFDLEVGRLTAGTENDGFMATLKVSFGILARVSGSQNGDVWRQLALNKISYWAYYALLRDGSFGPLAHRTWHYRP
ncbi:hypothetical protein DFP72DRAFT_850779 [Ephemerocybe angulata]|uniref:Uncharacterized protein n=1 Tax=Ephemerocybe angulata TaxID=980116 RepID=A0A8H6HT74_9AGAR|nr:hypothetical protein DFP72DRAFT_850779 [Tulosesus angulatus]